MSKYFLEIKNRLFLLFIAWISTVFVGYFYKEILLFVIIQPNKFISINEPLTLFYFIFTDITEILSVYLKLVTFLSLQIFFIYTLYHFFLFFSPALFKSEYRNCLFGVKVVSLMWLISLILSNCFLIPLTWNFFLSFQDLTANRSFNLHFEAKLNEYFNFYVSFYYLSGIYCQFFSLLLLYINHTNVNIQIIRKFRKLYYYCFIIIATLISPPEILSQIFISLTAIFIYEFLLLFFLLKARLKFVS